VRILALTAAILAAACARNTDAGGETTSTRAVAAPVSGEDVVRRMHAEYAGKWYRTLTFVQRTVRAGRPDETWYEAGMIPGKLRIDIAPIDSGNTFMYVGDSVYVFRGGKRVQAAKDRNLLMTLGFDVYGQSPDTTLTQLRAQNIDLSKVHETTWQGRPAWVVGAAAGDSTSNQFWVDRDRLLFVRLIEQRPSQQGPVRLDIEFNKYERLGGGWIAPEVVMRRNGQPFMQEIYSDMRADVPLDANLYNTTEYHRPGGVK
jgi:hypothetical protein